MLIEIVGWLYGIWGIVLIGFIVVWNLLRIYYAIRYCKEKGCCRRRECVIKSFCTRYKEILTKEEMQHLYALIEEYKSKGIFLL